jgi:hypothetical protein
VRSRPDSFYWSEDFKPGYNFWVWLRRQGGIDDSELLARLGEAANRYPTHERWAEFALVWEAWRREQIDRSIAESRETSPSTLREHYEAVAAVGLRAYRVEWVMAPLGERWLVPPDTAVLGSDGASGEQRRQAVIEAARALKG